MTMPGIAGAACWPRVSYSRGISMAVDDRAPYHADIYTSQLLVCMSDMGDVNHLGFVRHYAGGRKGYIK